jgi:Fe-S-cluster containining protein
VNCDVCRGACCESFKLSSGILNFLEGALLNEGGRWLRLHATLEGEFECRCTALIDGQCTIYADRPLNCKLYEIGGKDCLSTVKKRRTSIEYGAIRDVDDPLTLEEVT